MVGTVELSEIEVTDNAKLVQVYADGKFSTAIDGDKLFLLSTTQISRYNVIASFDNKGHSVIYDRDKANVFVDWSHEHFNQPGDLEKLPEYRIVEYLTNYLDQDLLKLITFTKDTTEIMEVVNKFDEHNKAKIMKAFENLNVLGDYTVPLTQAYTLNQVNYLYEKNLYYACFDTQNQKYDITNNGDFSKTYKNGSTGSWKRMLESSTSYIFFFKRTDTSTFYEENILKMIDEDLEGNPYKAANKFIDLENRFTKEIEKAVSNIANIKGFINTDTVYYPNIDDFVENIAKSIMAYQKTNNSIEKAKHRSDLVNLYSNCYLELQKGQDTLRKVTKQLEGIQ